MHVARSSGAPTRLPKFLRPSLFVPKRIFSNSFGNSFSRKSRTSSTPRVPAGVFDAGVNVFGVLAEDHHVHFLRMLHRRGDAGEILHRPQANVEVEHLPQRDVQRADAAADRRGQRAFDARRDIRETPRPCRPAASRRTCPSQPGRRKLPTTRSSSFRRRLSRPRRRKRARSPPRYRARCRRRE